MSKQLNMVQEFKERNIKAKSYIEAIKPYEQGKSKAGQLKDVIKLSSNENALGSSKKAIAAYKKHSNKLLRYADGSCAILREAIATKFKIDASQIVCGAGSDEMISLLIQAFAGENDEIIYSEYGFLMYPISAARFGAKAIAAKETNLTTNINNILGLITKKTKMIFIANPNNPTGSYINKSELEKLINNTPRDIVIVLDLAYAEFVTLGKSEYADVVDLVNRYDNVVMLRTFSKIYGLASLRLGWSYSSAYIAEVLNKTRGPFNVSGAAIEAGVAAINDEEFVKKSVNHNNKWLKIVINKLEKIKITTHPSIANFILIDFLTEDKSQKANKFLLENGVILREMSAYKLPNCLRMTIGTRGENLKVIELLEKFQTENGQV